jgi:L-threonylcarbamoyladenylate synthase
MEIIDKKYVLKHEKEIISKIISGKIFIYPTDTIYGIGCDATNSESVNKIREIKKRSDKPFSIIAPSKEWINENCNINDKIKAWLNKLPGSYTLILELKDKQAICEETNNIADTIGIRIPNHWFYEILKKAGKPFITTSVNITSKGFMTSIDSIDKEIMSKVDYAIDEGILNKKPSTIVNLIGENEKILR